MKPLPPLHPAGGISTEKPALGLLCPKGGNFVSPGLPGSGRAAPRETENNYYALENIKKLLAFPGIGNRNGC